MVEKKLSQEDHWSIVCAIVDGLRKNGSWTGHTHIQKATYLAQNLAGIPLDFKFKLYKHGPFSFDLQDEVGSLRSGRILNASPHEPYGLRFEVEDAYCSGAEEDYRDRIEFVTKALGNKKIVALEALSTALLVTLEKNTDDHNVRLRRLMELKPHLKVDLAEQALHDIDELRTQAESQFALG
jgi:uncharacterized protein YwgA